MPRGVLRAVVAPVVVVGGLLYFGGLLAVSLRSTPRLIPAGEPYAFCGFYLDCHLSATVDGFDVRPGPGGAQRYVVRVRFSNDARRARLTVRNPAVILVDARGTRLRPTAGAGDIRLGSETSVVTEFVFDSVPRLVDPALLVSEGSWVDRLTEKVLIGDPDSFLHQPVVMAVGGKR